MSNPPPSPSPPTPPSPSIGPDSASAAAQSSATSNPIESQPARVVATTGQLSAALEDVGLDIDQSALESLLLAADRRGYLEWVSLTQSGEYVWDLTDAPDRLADAIASALCEWLADRLGIDDGLDRKGG